MMGGREIFYFVLIGVYPMALVGAAISDITRLRIPNWLSATLFAAFPATAWLSDLGWALLFRGIACAMVLLGIGAFMAARGWLGGGDAKLLAATAAWIGWPGVLKFILIMGVVGGALALMLLLFRRARLSAIAASVPWLRALRNTAESVPYGVAIAAAGLAMLWELPVRTVMTN